MTLLRTYWRDVSRFCGCIHYSKTLVYTVTVDISNFYTLDLQKMHYSGCMYEIIVIFVVISMYNVKQEKHRVLRRANYDDIDRHYD